MKKGIILVIIFVLLLAPACRRKNEDDKNDANYSDKNNNQIFTSPQTVEGLKISLELDYTDISTIISGSVENITSEIIELNHIVIEFYSSNNELIQTSAGSVGKIIAPGETKTFTSEMKIVLKNATSVKYIIH